MKLPRFKLRDLFWLVLVVAMGCAWWVERSRLADALATSRAAESESRAYFEKAHKELRAANDWFHEHGYFLHPNGTVMEVPIPVNTYEAPQVRVPSGDAHYTGQEPSPVHAADVDCEPHRNCGW